MEAMPLDRALVISILKGGKSAYFAVRSRGVKVEHLRDKDQEVFALIAREVRDTGRLPTLREIKAATEEDLQAAVESSEPFDPLLYADQIIERELRGRLTEGLVEAAKTARDSAAEARDKLQTLVRETTWSMGSAVSYSDPSVAEGVVDAYNAAKNKKLLGLSSPWPTVDKHSRGLQKGELTVLIAKRKTGKSVCGSTRILDPLTGRRPTIREMYQAGGGSRFVAAWSKHDGVVPSPIGEMLYSGVKPCLRVTTETGRRIELSQEHPLLTPRGWRKAGDLRPGDVVAIARRLPVTDTGAKLVSEEDLRAAVYEAVEQGRVPPRMFQAGRRPLARFLRLVCGLLSTRLADGTLVLPDLSRGFAEDIQHAFLRLAAVVTIEWAGDGRFAVLLDDGQALKIAGVREDVARREAVLPADALPEIGATPPLRADGTVDLRRFGMFALRECPEHAWIASPALFWDRVVMIESIGPQECFDISVPSLESFVADDFVTHNTWVMLKWILHILQNDLEKNQSVLLVSLEMPARQVYRRVAAIDVGLDYKRLRAGQLDPTEEKKLEQWVESRRSLEDSDPTIKVVGADIARSVDDIADLVAEHNPALVAVDGLYILGRGSRRPLWERTIENIEGIKLDVCMRLDVPCLATTQFSGSKNRNDLNATADDAAYAKAIGDWADAMRGLFTNEAFDSTKQRVFRAMESREFQGEDIVIGFDLEKMDFREHYVIDPEKEAELTGKKDRKGKKGGRKGKKTKWAGDSEDLGDLAPLNEKPDDPGIEVLSQDDIDY